MARFARRGEWFSKEFLTEIGVSSVISHEEWHDLVHQHPKMLMKICSDRPIFERIGERAQTSIVSLILSEATHTPSLLRKLEVLDQDQVLSTRQQRLFRCYIMSIDIDALGATELSVASCFGRVIAALKERNWYVQNPAIWLVESWSPEQIGQLSGSKARLSWAEMSSSPRTAKCPRRAADFSLSSGYKCASNRGQSPSFEVLLLECFVNERRRASIQGKALGSVFLMRFARSSRMTLQQRVMDDVDCRPSKRERPRTGSIKTTFVESPKL